MISPDKMKEPYYRHHIAKGVDIIVGTMKDGSGMKTQAYRFNATEYPEPANMFQERVFTVDQAKKWCKDNDIKYILFTPAGESESKSFKYEAMEFNTKKELYQFMVDNHDQLVTQKKAVMKKADCPVIVSPVLVFDKKQQDAIKASGGSLADIPNMSSLKVIVIINTTNFLDNHGDVHIPGLWNRSLSNNKMMMHVQEHDMAFDKIISSGKDLKAYTKTYKWSELGYDYEGTTEALVFDSNILQKRNAFMLSQYANGWVQNHSVGMYYVKTDFAINDEDFPNEFEAWNKYYPMIANKDVADERGYFWYVLEAKCVEGSAVPLGSNSATPTVSIETGKDMVICPDCGHEFDYNSVEESGMGYVSCPKCGNVVNQKNNDSPIGTHKISDPGKSTQKSINYNYLSDNFKIK
jgi:DNA-directed RNA polymerase subunit RPC12/RpoP